jgi:acetyltransferase-like isoleucine patch superfamily enzyme
MSPLETLRTLAAKAFFRIEGWGRTVEAERLRRSFASFGPGSSLALPIHVLHPEHIFVGERVHIGPYTRLEAVVAYPRGGSQRFAPRLSIGDRTLIGFHVHIGCNHRVTIGRNVAIGARVYITDHLHRFEDPSLPAVDQPLSEGGEVVVEDDVLLGEGAVLLPGARIGRHSVVGPNAVISGEVPPYSVVRVAPPTIDPIRRPREGET